MDIVRAILMGLGCFGLLVVGSCTMFGFGTAALVEKASEVAKEKRNNPNKEAEREARIEEMNERAELMAERSSFSSSYDEGVYQDTADVTEPTLELEE